MNDERIKLIRYLEDLQDRLENNGNSNFQNRPYKLNIELMSSILNDTSNRDIDSGLLILLDDPEADGFARIKAARLIIRLRNTKGPPSIISNTEREELLDRLSELENRLGHGAFSDPQNRNTPGARHELRRMLELLRYPENKDVDKALRALLSDTKADSMSRVKAAKLLMRPSEHQTTEIYDADANG